MPNSLLTGIAGRVLRSRALMRAPIWVYRAGLGRVFGSRMLMLEHTGRSTGATRYVVLEVIDHPSPEVYVIASGFGERSQWLRNVMADARVRISVGGRRGLAATARRLSPEEVDLVLGRYVDQHPRAWASLRTVIEGTLQGRAEPPGSELPMVEITVDQTAATTGGPAS